VCFFGIRNQIQAGASDLSFVNDPFDTSSSDAVLEVTYSAGSYGGSGDGGAQFIVSTVRGGEGSEKGATRVTDTLSSL
jgi:hypothetical protein